MHSSFTARGAARMLWLPALLLLLGARVDAARLRKEALGDHIADYVKTNFDPYVKNAAEFQLNARRDNQGRVGPVDMPNVLLGDIMGDIQAPSVTSGSKQQVSVMVDILIVDPTAGSEGEQEENKGDTSSSTSLGYISVKVPIDLKADNSYVMNMEGINIEQAYNGDKKPVLVTELSSGAQDAPLAIIDKNEASQVVSRLLEHVNSWRKQKCGATSLPKLDSSDCAPMEGGSLFGWELQAGPGHTSKIVAITCKSAGNKGFWIGNIDIPRGGAVETGLFGGTYPGPCSILAKSAPSSMLPMAPLNEKTGNMRFSSHRREDALPLSIEDEHRRSRVKARLKGDRAAFLLRFEGATQLGEASKFDVQAAKETLSKIGASFDLRKHDVSGIEGSANACFQAPNRVRDQKDCMSCWAFTSASVYGDRKCLAERAAILKSTSSDKGSSEAVQAPPNLYSPASVLACKKPASCILGGFTNFVSMIESGIAKESCFPYKLRTDGSSRYKVKSGEMYLEADIVPHCPLNNEHFGGNGQCPGAPGKEYIAEDVKSYGVYRIHDNIDATRLAILMGGPVSAAITWGGDRQSGSDFMNYGTGPKCGTPGAVEGVCSNFDAKAGKNDPITLPGKSKLPKGNGGSGHAAGHAVSIIGWECKDGDYKDCSEGSWIIMNSWGRSWGSGGYGYVAFGAMDIESQIYLIDVAGIYDAKVASDFLPPPGGEPTPGNTQGKKNIEIQESRNPDQVLRHELGVLHDHGGGHFYIKSLAAGIISEKQNEVFGLNPHKVVSLKWKLSKGGKCRIMTFKKSQENQPIVCPVQAGTESFMNNVDMTGCVLQVAKSGMWTVGSCSKSTGQCELSHTSDSSIDHKIDSIGGEGQSGISTEANAQNRLQDKNLADVVLASSQNTDRFVLRVICTLGVNGSSLNSDNVAVTGVARQEIEIDPRPGKDNCESNTLKSMGNCKTPAYIVARPVPAGAVAIPVSDLTSQSGVLDSAAMKSILSPQEKLRRAQENEKLALEEARLETMQAEADAKEAAREEKAEKSSCPTNLVGVDQQMSDQDAQKALESLGLTGDEMAILSSREFGHSEAWNDCSWPERLAMAKMFHAETGMQ